MSWVLISVHSIIDNLLFRLDQLRREKEKDRMQQQLNERQKLIDRQIKYLEQKQNREEEILSGQIREAELRAQKLFEEKERRRKQMEEVIFVRVKRTSSHLFINQMKCFLISIRMR